MDSADVMSSSWQSEIDQPVMSKGICKDVLIQILSHASSSETDQELSGNIKIKELFGEGHKIHVGEGHKIHVYCLFLRIFYPINYFMCV